MLFTLLLVAIIVICFLFGFESRKRDIETKEWKDYKAKNKYDDRNYQARNDLREAFTGEETKEVREWKYNIDDVFGYYITVRAIVLVITGICLFVAVIFIIVVQSGKESAYLQYQNKRTILMVQYERLDTENLNLMVNGDLGSLSDVYSDIITYNNIIIRADYWSDNLWFNWFYNGRLADLEPIVVE